MRRLKLAELVAIGLLTSLVPTATAFTFVGVCEGPDPACSVEEGGIAVVHGVITSAREALREADDAVPPRGEALASGAPQLPVETRAAPVELPDFGNAARSLVASPTALPADMPAAGIPSVPPPAAHDVEGPTEPLPPPSSPTRSEAAPPAALAPARDDAAAWGTVLLIPGGSTALPGAMSPSGLQGADLPLAHGPLPEGTLDAASTGASIQAWARPGALDAWLGVALFLGVVFSIMHYAVLNVPPQATLYHQVERGRVLFNRRRREILACVRSRPGATPAEIASVVGVAYNTARHHLDVLQRFSMVTSRTMGPSVRYFENHGRYTPREQRHIAMTAAEENACLLRLLARLPGIPQKELTFRLGLAKSTVSRRIKILETAGLITRSGGGFTLTPEGAGALATRRARSSLQ